MKRKATRFWPGEFIDCIVHGVAKSQTQLSDFSFIKKKKKKVKGMSKDIYCSIVCDRINLEITQMLINRR